MSLAIASYLKRAAGPLLKSPLADGAAGEALITDGAGNLSFAAPEPAAHDHDGDYDALGAAATAISAHAAAGDPHPQYLTAAEGNAAYDALGAAAAAQAASQPLDTQLTSLAGLAYSGNANKVIRVNAGETAFELVTPAAGGSAEIDINSQSGNYTLQASDLGDLVDFTAAATLSLLAAATAGDRFYCWVRNSASVSSLLIVDGNGSETIDGALTLMMFAGEVRLLIGNGSGWISLQIERPLLGVITKPVDSAFAWINQSTATIATTRGGLVLGDVSAGSTFNWRIRKKSAPATPYTITACFTLGIATGGLGGGGLLFRQSSDGKLHAFEVQIDNNDATYVDSRKMTNPTTHSADYSLVQNSNRLQPPGPLWMRIADDGTSRICSWSADGENFIVFHTVGRTDFLTADEVGFYISPYNRETRLTLLSWREA